MKPRIFHSNESRPRRRRQLAKAANPAAAAVEFDHLSKSRSTTKQALTFSTLGLEGSNHHFVLEQYLAAHGIAQASRIVLFDDFHAGACADRR